MDIKKHTEIRVNIPGVSGVTRWDEDDPRDHENLGRDEQAALQAWIAVAMKPARTVGPSTSYVMKHDFESAGGFYVTNGQMKGAMLAAGYKPSKRSEQNWRFRQRPTNKHADGYSYYHPLPDEADPDVARFKDLVERVRARRAS